MLQVVRIEGSDTSPARSRGLRFRPVSFLQPDSRRDEHEHCFLALFGCRFRRAFVEVGLGFRLRVLVYPHLPPAKAGRDELISHGRLYDSVESWPLPLLGRREIPCSE